MTGYVIHDGDLPQSTQGQYGPGMYYEGNESQAKSKSGPLRQNYSPMEVGDNHLELGPGENVWTSPERWQGNESGQQAALESAIGHNDWAPLHTVLRSKAYQGVRRIDLSGTVKSGMAFQDATSSPSLQNTTASSDTAL